MNADRLPNPVMQLPLRLRHQLDHLIRTSDDLRSLLNRVGAIDEFPGGPFSARDEVLLALLAARVLAPRDLEAQEAFVEAFLNDALWIEVVYSPHGQRHLGDEWSYATLYLLAGEIMSAVSKRLGRTAGVIAVVVAGVFDLTTLGTTGDSIIYEDLGLRGPEIEWIAEHANAAPFGVAAVRVVLPDGRVYRLEFASSGDGVRQRVGGPGEQWG